MTNNWVTESLIGVIVAITSNLMIEYFTQIFSNPDGQMVFYTVITLFSLINLFAGLYGAYMFGVIFSISTIVIGVISNDFKSVFTVIISFWFILFGMSLNKFKR